MEEDIQNYLPTLMFRGTPCTTQNLSQICQVLSTNIIMFKSERLKSLLKKGYDVNPFFFSRKYASNASFKIIDIY